MQYRQKVDIISGLLGKTPYAEIREDGRRETLAQNIVAFLHRKGDTKQTREGVITMAAILDNDILNYYGNLAFCEVTIALDWGTRGEFGDYTAVTADNLFSYVRKYAESDERVEAIELRKAHRALPAVTKDDPRLVAVIECENRMKADVDAKNLKKWHSEGIEKWNLRQKQAVDLWTQYRECGRFPAYSAEDKSSFVRLYFIYNWMDQTGIINKLIDDFELEKAGQQFEFEKNKLKQMALVSAAKLEAIFSNATRQNFDLGSIFQGMARVTTDEQKADFQELSIVMSVYV